MSSSIVGLIPSNKDNERKFLSYVFKNPTELYRLDPALFSDKLYKAIYYSIEDLYTGGKHLDVDIVSDLVKADIGLDEKESIQDIYDDFDDFENIDHVITTIKDTKVSKNIASSIQDVLTEVISHGKLNKEKLRDLGDNLTDDLYLMEEESSLMDGEELADLYVDIMEKRRRGEGRKTLGFSEIDKHLTRPGAAGEMTGIVALKGVGKCLSYSTLILTDEGFKRIGEYSNNIKGFSDTECTLMTKDGVRDASKFFEEEVDYYYKIKTKFGFEVECTDTHPLYKMFEDRSFDYIEAKNLKVGDILPLMIDTDVYTKEPEEIVYEDFKFYGNKVQEAEVIRLIPPKFLTKDLARLLGYYTANGSGYRIISSNNIKIKEDIKNIVKSISPDSDISIGNGAIQFGSREFRDFIKYLHGYSLDIKNVTARYKEIPKFILEGTKENQIEYLKGLFDCDSWLNDDTRLEYYTASKKLSQQVQLILLNIGVFSQRSSKRVKGYDWDYYTVSISSEDFDSYKKIVNYESNKYTFTEQSFKRNTNIKIIPNFRELIDREIGSLREDLNVSKNGRYGSYKSFSVGNYSKFFGKNITYYSLSKLKDFIDSETDFHGYEQIKTIRGLIDEVLSLNYIYDKIDTIEVINESIKVYDFNIPVVHNFYTNGIISHNSILGKSIENSLVNRGTCVVSLNLEMEPESSLDRLLCIRENVSIQDLLDPKDAQMERRIKRGIDRFRAIKNYAYYPDPSLNLPRLDALLYEAKNKFRASGVLPDDEYMLVVFDLVDMLEEFDGARPEQIKANVNKLHRIIRKHRCHGVLLLQAAENKFRGGKIFKDPDELEHFRIGLEDIADGAAYAQRCRVVMSINRPVHMKKTFFPESIAEWETERDIINLNIIKQNDGKLGFTQFVFGDNFRMYPLFIDKAKMDEE